MHKSYYILCTLFFMLSAQECLEPKRRKKQPLKELQQKVVEQSKHVVLECSTLIQQVVEMLDEGEEGILGGENKEQLRKYSENLMQVEVAIQKCKNEIELIKKEK